LPPSSFVFGLLSPHPHETITAKTIKTTKIFFIFSSYKRDLSHSFKMTQNVILSKAKNLDIPLTLSMTKILNFIKNFLENQDLRVVL